jgi:hypothetical protein
MPPNAMLQSFMKDLMPKAMDTSHQISIVNDNAKNRAPISPTKSPTCKRRSHQELLHECNMKGFVETTIRSVTADRDGISYMKNHDKRETRWQSMGKPSEARLVTPKRWSCPPAFEMLNSLSSAECEELFAERDFEFDLTRRFSPKELDNCLSELLRDTTLSAASVSLANVDEYTGACCGTR